MKITIPEFLFNEFQARFAALVKKAKKLGLPEPTFEIVEKYWSEGKDKIEMIDMEISEQSIVLNGWRFLAGIEHLPTGNLVKSYVDTLPTEYRTCKPACDHCHKSRPRNKTFVVTNGETNLQIGSTCVKDFLGDNCPEKIVNYLETFFSFQDFTDENEWSQRCPRDRFGLNIIECFEASARLIREYGFTSKARETETNPSTSVFVGNFLYKPEAFKRDGIEIEEIDVKTAKLTLQWIKTNTSESDYMHNLKVLCETDFARYKDLNLLVSAVGCYLGDMAKKASASVVESEYYGNIGDKISIHCSYVGSVNFDGYYGTTFFHKFQSGAFHFVWKTGKSLSLEIGSEGEIKGTVKDHSEYKGVKQTILTRCKLV